MIGKIVDSFGLLFNLIGIILLFRFGFPQPDFKETVGIAMEDYTPVGNGMLAKDFAIMQKKLRNKYKKTSIISLVFILVGIFVQIVSLWL